MCSWEQNVVHVNGYHEYYETNHTPAQLVLQSSVCNPICEEAQVHEYPHGQQFVN